MARRLATALAALTALASSLGAAVPPARAAEPPSPGAADTLVLAPVGGDVLAVIRNGNVDDLDLGAATQALAGDFTANAGTDVFLYTPGPGLDGVLDITPVGAGGVGIAFTEVPVSGTYTPVVGQFGQGPMDDILWYGPGGVPDTLWFFHENGTHSEARVPVTGAYRPTVLDANGDAWDDIVWYAPGRAKDSLWLFRPGSSWYQSIPLTIDGSDYQLVPGHFGEPAGSAGGDRLVFASPRSSSIWTFDTAGGHTSAPFTTVLRYEPVVADFFGRGVDSILMYRPGGNEDMVTFDAEGSYQPISPLVVWGDYDHAVGDFDGNGYDDVAWVADGVVRMWSFADVDGGYTTARYDTGAIASVPITSTTEDPA